MIDIIVDDTVVATPGIETPSIEQMQAWAISAAEESSAHIAIRIVDSATMLNLNDDYRNKAAPTNVLSFPAQIDPEIAVLLDEPVSLGDIAICAEVVGQEAEQQQKSSQAHWAHMIVHGVLHLRGFDHITEHDASIMEALETRLLSDMGFADPYQLQESGNTRPGSNLSHSARAPAGFRI